MATFASRWPRSTRRSTAWKSAGGSRAGGWRRPASAGAAITGSPTRAGKCWPSSARTGGGSSRRWDRWPASGSRPEGRVQSKRHIMATGRNWKADVLEHARATGAANLPAHTVEELAAHLEDIYLHAAGKGPSESEAQSAPSAALTESSLRQVPVVRTRLPESRPVNDPSAGSG